MRTRSCSPPRYASLLPGGAADRASGFDAAWGEIREPAIRAAATLTIALPKRGVQTSAARAHVGDLSCADIGVPPELYARLSPLIDLLPVFAAGDILRVVR